MDANSFWHVELKMHFSSLDVGKSIALLVDDAFHSLQGSQRLGSSDTNSHLHTSLFTSEMVIIAIDPTCPVHR